MQVIYSLHICDLVWTWTVLQFGLTRINTGGVGWGLYKYLWWREWHLQQNNKKIIYIYIYLTSYNILVRYIRFDGEDFLGTGPDALGIGTVEFWEEGVL